MVIFVIIIFFNLTTYQEGCHVMGSFIGNELLISKEYKTIKIV